MDEVEELVARIGDGDQSAEYELVKRYSKVLKLIVTHNFWGHWFIEDVVQDTFAAAIVALREGRLRKASALPSYLQSIAIKIGFQYLNMGKRHGPLQYQVDIDAIADTSADLFGDCELHDLMEYVQRTVQEMPVERDRIILTRFYFECVDKPKICNDLGLTPEHFDRVLHRARKRLKAMIDDDPDSTNLMTALILISGGAFWTSSFWSSVQ